MHGFYRLGAAIGKKIRRDQEEAEREEAIRKAQEEAAGRAAEAQRKAEEEQRHQELMGNLMNLDGTIGLHGNQDSQPLSDKLMPLDEGGNQAPQRAGSGSVTAKLMPLDEGGQVQPRAGTNFFGSNPGPSGNETGVVDLRSVGVSDPRQLHVDPSTLKQGGPCPLDANGMPECGAPIGESDQSSSASAGDVPELKVKSLDDEKPKIDPLPTPQHPILRAPSNEEQNGILHVPAQEDREEAQHDYYEDNRWQNDRPKPEAQTEEPADPAP